MTAAPPVASRRRILFCDHTVAMSGGEIALYNLLRYLNPERYEPVVVLFAEGPLNLRLREAGIRVREVFLDKRIADVRKDTLGKSGILRASLSPRTVPFLFKLGRVIREEAPDIVHTNSLKADLLGGVAARLARKKVVWHIRDRIAEDYLPGPAGALVRKLARVVPHRVIVNSAATLETLGFPPNNRRGVVVHDGMEPTAEPPPYPPPGDPVIALVGRITPWKGQHIFLEAAHRVHQKHPTARFLIVGTTMFGEHEYEQHVRKQCSDLGLDGVVEFTGFVENIFDLYEQLTVLVHASTVPEPFGQVVLEGMMSGRPVVATRGGGVTEIVVDGETGLLVPMANAAAMAEAISFLLENPERARLMAQAGRQRALSQFTIDRTARKVEAVYEEILTRSS